MDWKIGAAVAVILAIAVTAFFSGNVAIPSFSTSGVSGFFAAATGGSAKNFTVDAVIDTVSMAFDTKADSITVELPSPSKMTVGGSLLDLSSRPMVIIELRGWSGRITENGTLSLDGMADEITVDGIVFTSAGKSSTLTIDGAAFNNLNVRGIALNSLVFPEANGYVYVNGGKTTVNVDKEPLELTSFSGDITIDTSLRLSGIARAVSVSGENKISVV